MADEPRSPPHYPRHGEPSLAAPLRQGDRGDAREFRPQWHATHAPRTARLAGRGFHGARLEREAPASVAYDLDGLPAIGTTAAAGRAVGSQHGRPRERTALADEPAPIGSRSSPRRGSGGER